MRKLIKFVSSALIVSLMVCFAACFTACSSDTASTEETEAALITSEWDFAKVERKDWSSTKSEWLAANALSPADAMPLPVFVSDGETFTLQFNGKDHDGALVQLEDGSYELYDANDEDNKWGTATITGNTLTLRLGDDVATIYFET